MKEGQEASVTAQSAGSKLASADFHGSEVVVVRSRCVGMVGFKGIVVRDTKFTFQIITKKNELKSNLSSMYGRTWFSDIMSSYTQEAYNIPIRDTTAGSKGGRF